LSRRVEGLKPSAWRLALGGAAMAAGCALLAMSAGAGPGTAAALMAGAVALLTLAEVWQTVGGWGASFALTGPADRSLGLSLFNLGPTLASVAGPWLVTAVVIQAGPLGWAGFGAACLLAGAGARLAAAGRTGAGQTDPAPTKEGTVT
jgi:hypothetical protein